jgi:hypothetical protein
MTPQNLSQNDLIQTGTELSNNTEPTIVKSDESKDIKFEEIITGVISEPNVPEVVITEGVIIEPTTSELKVTEIIATEQKVDVDHPMVEIQSKVQEVVNVINNHVTNKTDEATVKVVKDTINEVSNDYVKDKIIIPFEKVALLAAKVSHDALLNLEQFAVSGNHWWNSAWWIKIKAQLFNAIVYILIGVLLGSFIATKYYEYRMDENTQLLSAMIYKGKIYDLKVRLQ